MEKRVRRGAPLAAILGVALLLRLIALRSRGIWYDDAFSIFLVRQSWARIVAGTAADTMPPLYYFLLHLWRGLGEGVATLRLLNVIISLMTVALTYRLATLLFDGRTGLWAALFVALSPFQIYHAQELRMYAALCLNLLLYLYFLARLVRGVDRRPWVSWLGLALGGALAMYSHNLAIFTLLAADLFLLFKRRWGVLGRLLLAQLATGALVSPWLLLIPAQVAKIQRAFWTPRPGLLEAVQALLTFHTNLPLPDPLIPPALTAALLFLALVIYELARRHRRDAGVQLLAAFSLFPPSLLFAASYLMRPLFVPRGLILSSIAYYTLGAVVVARQPRRWLGGGLALLLVVPALSALPGAYTFAAFPRSPYEQAVAFLRERVAAGDVVLHDNKLSYFPMHYYAPELPQCFLPDEPGSPNDTLAPASQEAMGIRPVESVEAATAGASRLWFVYFTRAVEEYRAAGLPGHPLLDALASDWRQVEHVAFGDLEVCLFERR